MLDSVTEELREIRRVVSESGILLGYTRNHIRAPSVQCSRENIETTKAQIPRMTAEESHSGSRSQVGKGKPIRPVAVSCRTPSPSVPRSKTGEAGFWNRLELA